DNLGRGILVVERVFVVDFSEGRDAGRLRAGTGPPPFRNVAALSLSEAVPCEGAIPEHVANVALARYGAGSRLGVFCLRVIGRRTAGEQPDGRSHGEHTESANQNTAKRW